MARIRKDDLVEVIAGNDRGKRGRVLKVLPKKERVLVQGVNLRWKHMRKSQQSPQGGRIRKEIPIHASNVMPVDESSDARTRVAYVVKDGKKARVARKSGHVIGTAAAAAESSAAPKKKAKKKAKAKAKKEKE
jgi:large subunit ribosomal protein L24